MVRRHFFRSSWIQVLLASVLAGGVVALAPADAASQMLPLIVDQTEHHAGTYWWSAGRRDLSRAVDRALFSDELPPVVSASIVQGLTISRVFDRANLSVSHAQQIASMAGATTFFLGYARADADAISWLDSAAAVVRIQGRLYDTRSGALLSEGEFVGRGVSSAIPAAIRVAARSAAQSLATFVPSGAIGAADEGALRVSVRVAGSADTFVRIRDVVARSVADLADIVECQATESEITLCVQALPGQDAHALQARIATALRAPTEGVVVDRLEAESLAMRVVAHAAPVAPDGVDRTFP